MVKGLNSVRQVLDQVVAKLGIERRLKEKTLYDLWPAIAGEMIAKRSRCLYIDYEGNLVVSVADSACGQELGLLKHKLLKTVQQFAVKLGLNIKGIRLDLKHYHSRQEEDFNTQDEAVEKLYEKPDKQALEKIELSAEELAAVEKLKNELALISENDLTKPNADKVLYLYECQLRLKSWQKEQGFSACSKCGDYEARLLGSNMLCTNCYFQTQT